LQEDAASLGVVLFSTPFDIQALEFLESIAMPCFKVASGCAKDVQLLRAMAKIGKPVFLSTGGCDLEDVKRAVRELGDCPLVVMQCTAAYPAAAEDMQLRVIETYGKEFPHAALGLSDHYHTIVFGPVAYALGARVFEKHFTLDRAAKGTDHGFSLEPPGLRKYVRDVRRTASALGDGRKRPLDSEGQPLLKMAKGLYALRPIEAGEEINAGNVAPKSPAEGMSAWKWDRAIGKHALRPFGQDEPLSSGDLE